MARLRHALILAFITAFLAACTGPEANDFTEPPNGEPLPNGGEAFTTTEITQFDYPWAMTFLPDGRLLVTEMSGTLHLVDLEADSRASLSGVPDVVHIEQGGLGDVVLHPDYESNQLVYFSYVEPGDGELLGGVVARAQLQLDDNGGGVLQNVETIWSQSPKTTDEGHFGYRIAFDDSGMLWISSSDRREMQPAQDLGTNLGKLIRLHDDGTVPDDNPFADQGDVAAQVWSMGHRNILGIVFDANGRLWAHEMGPMDGDELNLIERGANYGWPEVSNGNHYDGTPIPDHDTSADFVPPIITWTPVISPAGFIIYDGSLFPSWTGSGFIGGLSSMAVVRVEFDGNSAQEAERFDMQRRIREVEQGPDGALWLLEDGTREGSGWLLKLTPEEDGAM